MRIVWRMFLVIIGLSMGQLSFWTSSPDPFADVMISTVVAYGLVFLCLLLVSIEWNLRAVARALNPDKKIPAYNRRSVLGTIPWCIAAVAIPVALHPENFPVNLISVGLLVFALAVFAHSLEQISDDIAHIAKAIDASAETFDDPSNVGPLENIRRLRRALNRDDLV